MSRGGKRGGAKRNAPGADGPARGGPAPTSAGGNGATKVLKKRVTGKVVQWKGKFGWIQPTQPIDHPEASKNGGKIYMAHEEVEENISGVGAQVTFFVWLDGKGLAAKNIRTGGAGGQQGGAAANGGANGRAPSNGAGQQQAGGRQKMGGQRLTGTVHSWRGSFGWIVPNVKLNYPDQKKDGKVYFSQQDVEQELSGVGATVTFALYKDKTGYGAMQVRPGKGGSGPIPSASQGKQQQGKQQPQGKWVQAKQQQGKQQLVKNTKLKTKKEQVKREPREATPLDKSQREAVTGEAISGVVIRAVGDRVAFIIPDGEVDHPKFEESKTLFLHKDDFEGDEFPKIGASVMFSVYADQKGLGAEGCSLLEQGDGKVPEHLKGEVKKRKRAGRKEKKKKGKDEKPASNVKVGAFAKKQAEKQAQKKKRNRKGKGGEGGEKKEKKDKGPSGPDLPRERVSDALVTGEVLMMGRTFGWVKPSEPVSHDLASKHGGKIYLHKKDIAEGADLKKGSTVTFKLYADASGLGAEECS